MKEFINKLKTFYGLAGSISVVLPGLSFFFLYSPPLFDQISILVSALAVAFLWMGFKTGKETETDLILKKALQYIVGGFILTIFYLVLLDATSIAIGNSKQTTHYQIGYGMSKWSMTPDGLSLSQIKPCGQSKLELLRCKGATKEHVYDLWKKWTINFFGVVNILLFSCASLFWAFGWGKLMKTV